VGFSAGEAPGSSATAVSSDSTSRLKRSPDRNRCQTQFERLDWPYIEGLRLDEAMHPLTIPRAGLLRRDVAASKRRRRSNWLCHGNMASRNQSIVRIKLVEDQPPTAWTSRAPREYGFYSNVNPNRDHPRWSQKDGAPDRRVRVERHFDVQRLWRPGFAALHRDDLIKYF